MVPAEVVVVRSTPRVLSVRRRHASVTTSLAYAAVMAVEHVRLLGTWLKTAALTPVTVQRVYRVAQPTLHAQAGSVVQQAMVSVRISLSLVRLAVAIASVTPVPALTVFVVRAPVGVSVRLARQAKRDRLMEAVHRLLRGVTLTMNVRDRMLLPVVRLACVMARGLAPFIPHPQHA